MYKFNKIRHDIIKQCHGNYQEIKKFNYKLEIGIGIFRNSTQKYLGVLRGSFLGFGCPKRHPETLLAKTMPISACDTQKHLDKKRIVWKTIIENNLSGEYVNISS